MGGVSAPTTETATGFWEEHPSGEATEKSIAAAEQVYRETSKQVLEGILPLYEQSEGAHG